MIKFKQYGDLKKTFRFLKSSNKAKYQKALEKCARAGTLALAEATPVDTGKTSQSWSYEITHTDTTTTIQWNNSNVVNYVNIALIIQYGHATRFGGYVVGVDYINPALKPVFEKYIDKIWEEVVS